jgi:hypothetical protein
VAVVGVASDVGAVAVVDAEDRVATAAAAGAVAATTVVVAVAVVVDPASRAK